MTDVLGGEVRRSGQREFGHAHVRVTGNGSPPRLFQEIPADFRVWASHGDDVSTRAAGLFGRGHQRDRPDRRDGSAGTPALRPAVSSRSRAHRSRCSRSSVTSPTACAGARATGRLRRSSTKPPSASDARSATAASSAGCRAAWIPRSPRCSFIARSVRPADVHLRRQRPAAIRRGQADRRRFTEKMRLPLDFVDAADIFLERLAGVTEPETKRKIIGATFIDVFENRANELGELRLPGAGHALSGRHRIGVGRRPGRGHQEPSQRRRPP